MAARVVESRGAAGRRRRADAATGRVIEAGAAVTVGHRRAGAATIRPIEPGLLAGLRRQREQGESGCDSDHTFDPTLDDLPHLDVFFSPLTQFL
jgi:hypothetical protein